MRKWILAFLMAFLPAFSRAQEESVLRAALFLSGASSEEEVDQEWVWRLETAGKVKINSARLRPGLLTDFQIASIGRYRASYGDILSWEELALVDGFDRETVRVLRPFLSLESRRLPGATDTVKVRSEAILRGTLKNFGIKAKTGTDTWRVGGAWRAPDWTAHAEWSGGPVRLVIGDFNARFGEGLCFWSGFSMESLSTVDAFFKRPTGLSPVWSYSSADVHRGLAAEYEGAGWRVSAFGTLKKVFGLHGEYQGRLGQASVTAGWSKADGWSASMAGRMNLRGWDLGAEAAFRHGFPAGKASLRSRAGENGKWALQLRIIPSRFSGKKNGEYALAGGYSLKSGRWVQLAGQSGFGSSVPAWNLSLTVDASLLPRPGVDPRRHQLRAYLTGSWQFASAWKGEIRVTERYRNYEPSRLSLRGSIQFSSGPWLSVLRAEGVHCKDWGCLCYLEGGYKGTSLQAYLRFSGFSIANWDDRIYVYERDAPGNFSVPAYSGKGISLQGMAGYKLRLGKWTLKAYLRGGYMIRVQKEPSPTLAVQLQVQR